MKMVHIKRKFIITCLLLTGFIGGTVSTIAQPPADSLPLYRKFPFVPSFKLMKSDSSYFIMKDMVAKKGPAVVILFSPTCSHCQHQAEEITSHMEELHDVTFLFATGYPLAEMKQYISDYGLDRFPNIYVGQDLGEFLGNYYKVKGIPSIYVYNKKGTLVDEFSTNVKANQLLKAIEK